MVTKSKTAETKTAAAPAKKSASPAKPAVDAKLLATVPERYRNFVRPGFLTKEGKPVTLASLVKTVNDSYAKADDHTLTCACAIAATSSAWKLARLARARHGTPLPRRTSRNCPNGACASLR